MNLTLSGYSTALFSTWYFVEEWGLLLDAGDGAISALLQKSRKINHIFLSHADRDHITGLLQLNHLNARDGFPKVYYPKDSLSIPALGQFSKRFDKQVEATEWIGVDENSAIEIKKNIWVQPVKNSHVASAGPLAKSFGYLVQQRKQKLKPEYLTLSQKEIIALRNEIGDENLTYEVRENLLGYSGDTPVENFHIWNGTPVLIHEATFLSSNVYSDDDPRNSKHSLLEDVLTAAKENNIGLLVLGHFSSRYTAEEIDHCIATCSRDLKLSFPVLRLLPGETVLDILNKKPVYQP
jgi:ribonuclease Z